MTQVLIGHRYLLLSPLGRGSMGAVYKARDRLTGQIVALKRVEISLTDSERLSTQTLAEPATSGLQAASAASVSTSDRSMSSEVSQLYRLALAWEFQVLSSLRHPHIVSVLDYGFWEGQPYFTMELLPSSQTLFDAGRNRCTSAKIRLLAQVLLALSYIHRRSVLHRDLKPSNVLCVGDCVKVVDFGVATAIGNAYNIAGTLEYMAPEVLIGEKPSPAADLYSFGVMACELLSDQYPFDRSSATRFLADVLAPQDLHKIHEHWATIKIVCTKLKPSSGMPSAAQPDEHSNAVLERINPEALREVVRRLLARRPEERFASAEAALEALEVATGESFGAAAESTRESFLQAARLIGRERELEQLERALAEARKGQGGAWLVGGESGIGKSRLLDELRTLALVRGAQVVRGQAVSGGGTAYGEWGQALRPLCLRMKPSSLEASVLKTLVPDLAELLQDVVADPPALEPGATQQRLINTAFSLLLEQEVPTVVILEDIHWASPESLSLLRRLLPQLQNSKLLLVASYRNDEKASLPEQLPGIALLNLVRLSREQVAQLSASMLGSAGRGAELVALLEKESEGNTYFLIETVRALAEEAGGLQSVGREKLPQTLPALGLQAILSRRLQRVPLGWQRLLQLAAIAGRQVDLRLLPELSSGVEEFLRECANAAVLEVVEQQWRFSHDKLREALLSSLSAAERRALHEQVAVALERAYSGELEQQAVRLAFHYQAAEKDEQTAHYAAMAGALSRRTGALREAATQLERALVYYDQVAAAPLLRARLRRLLAESQLGRGELHQVLEHCQRAMELLGTPMPTHRPQLIRELSIRMAGFLLSLLWPQPSKCSKEDLPRLQELVELGWTYGLCLIWTGRGEEALLFSLMLERFARQMNSADAQLSSLAGLASMFHLIGLRRLALQCRSRAQRLLPVCRLQSQKNFLQAESIILGPSGPWNEYAAAGERLREVGRQLGDIYAVSFALAMQMQLYLDCAKLDLVASRNAELRTLVERPESQQFEAVASTFEGLLALYRGDLTAAMELGQTAARAARKAGDKLWEAHAIAVQGLAQLRADHDLEALGLAQRLQAIMADGVTSRLLALECMAAAAEIFFSLWRKGGGGSAWLADSVRKQARVAVSQLERTGERGRTRFLLWSGVWASLRGQRGLALKQLEASLAESRLRQMPFEEGLACSELSRVLGKMDPAGLAHRDRAVAIFQAANAPWYKGRAETLPT